MSVKQMSRAGLCAALYVSLTLLLEPLSFGAVQCRAAEMLCVLPIYGSWGVWGLAVGCLLANLLGGAALPDVVFGTLATLLGALGTRRLRQRGTVALLPPVLTNTLILPFVFRYAYGIAGSLLYFAMTVAAGELISAGVLGLLLKRILDRRKASLFPD